MNETLCQPNSTLKLLIQYAPDSFNHLLDCCISSYTEREQIQGKIFFDFFLFKPPIEATSLCKHNSSELIFPELIDSLDRQYLLMHPIFEAFMKVY